MDGGSEEANGRRLGHLRSPLVKGAAAAFAVILSVETGLDALARLPLPDQATAASRLASRLTQARALSAPGLAAEEEAVVALFSAATPSVVNITNLIGARGMGSLDFKEIPQGTGSGFVWDRKGHVVTNFHVIKGASSVKVTFIDNRTYDARVVGFDEDRDVAVLQVTCPFLLSTVAYATRVPDFFQKLPKIKGQMMALEPTGTDLEEFSPLFHCLFFSQCVCSHWVTLGRCRRSRPPRSSPSRSARAPT